MRKQQYKKGFVWLLLFTLVQSGFAQTQTYGGWSEPIFEDNAAEFDAPAGSFEFCAMYGTYRAEDKRWAHDFGWEAEVVFTKRFGIELGFYSTWSKQPPLSKTARYEPTKQLEFSGVAIGAQYILQKTERQIWATGIDFLGSNWSRYSLREMVEWGIKPNIIYGRKWSGGFDAQARLTPVLAFSDKKGQLMGTAQAAFFWQTKWCSLGTELGGGSDGLPLAFVAPQVGFYLADFSLWLGWWQPTYFKAEKAVGYFSINLCYNWKQDEGF